MVSLKLRMSATSGKSTLQVDGRDKSVMSRGEKGEQEREKTNQFGTIKEARPLSTLAPNHPQPSSIHPFPSEWWGYARTHTHAQGRNEIGDKEKKGNYFAVVLDQIK